MTRTLGYDVGHGHRYSSLEALATAVRAKLALGPLQCLPAFDMFEQLGRLDWGLPYPVEPHVEESPREGLTRFRPEAKRFELVLSPTTYDDLDAQRPRAAFTFAHELDHLVDHWQLLLEMNVIPHEERALMRVVAVHPQYRDSEWQANGFAGALLAPAAGLAVLERRGQLSPTTIAATYGCSLTAANVRLEVYRKKKHELLRATRQTTLL